MQALGDPGDAILDGLRRILGGSQNGGRKQAPAPRRQRKFAQRVAGEAAGLAIVRCVEGRIADREIDRQNGNPRGGQPPGDLLVCCLIVAVLNVEVDLALHGIFGVGNGLCPFARIVVEHQVDRQAACAEHEARTNVFAREAEPFDPCTGIVGEVGECNREAALLSNGAS